MKITQLHNLHNYPTIPCSGCSGGNFVPETIPNNMESAK